MVMKANELRIGNYINDITGGVCQVRGITSGGIWIRNNAGPGAESNFSPIPITEEWLVKLGLEGSDEYSSSNEWCNYSADKSFVIEYFHSGFHFTGGEGVSSYSKPLNFVHEIQNLFHALTGEELEIKETVQ